MVPHKQDTPVIVPETFVFPREPHKVVAPNPENIIIGDDAATAATTRVELHIFGVNVGAVTVIQSHGFGVKIVLGLPGTARKLEFFKIVLKWVHFITFSLF